MQTELTKQTEINMTEQKQHICWLLMLFRIWKYFYADYYYYVMVVTNVVRFGIREFPIIHTYLQQGGMHVHILF